MRGGLHAHEELSNECVNDPAQIESDATRAMVDGLEHVSASARVSANERPSVTVSASANESESESENESEDAKMNRLNQGGDSRRAQLATWTARTKA